MKYKRIILILLITSTLLISGCWDSIELNEQAIILGIGIDITKEGDYQLSTQIVIPSALGSTQGGGGGEKQFFVATVIAPTLGEGLQKLQNKVSRTLNRGHRQSIYIGEKFAKQGIQELLDIISRDPQSRLTADFSVIKGDQAYEALNITPPLEYATSIGSLKIHEQRFISAKNTLLDFMVVDTSESQSPILPTFKVLQDEKVFQSSGSAIFNKQKEVVGFLSEEETNDASWVLGDIPNYNIKAFIPQGKGNVNLIIDSLKSNIEPIFEQNRVGFQITLSGKGEVKANTTTYDLTKPDLLKKVEAEIEDNIEKRVSILIKRVQSEYGMDIFGLGETIFRKKPTQWKKVKNKWESEFQQADISVHVNLNIEQIGLTGSTHSQYDAIP